MERDVWSLRSRRSYRVIEKAFRGGRDRFGFRLNEYSVQGNHIHLIAEAVDATALARGIKGLSIRIALGLNRLMSRKGRVIADRWHQHILRTPSEVKRALAYVLNNFRKHQAQQRKLAPRSAPAAAQASTTAGAIIDRFSSAIAGAPIVRARTWLLHQAQLR
jgi:REP element-mobilizing transposase RayT